MKNLKLFPIAILLLFYLVAFLYLSTKHTMMNTQEHLAYKPFEKFSMQVDHEEWNGKLEPGRYTKSGILIIKQ